MKPGAMVRRWVAIAVGTTFVLALGLSVLVRQHTAVPASPEEASSTDGDDRKVVAVATAALAKNPIATAKVERRLLAPDLLVVGSVARDQDHYAVVGPLVAGRVARLDAGLGDVVHAGQVLAIIESSDVGQAQADYLSARARANAAQANLRRERELAEKHISSVRERELAEAQAISETAGLRAAEERLRAYGLGPAEIATLERSRTSGGRVPLRAPITGTVVARTVALGQAVERANDAFIIVDLRHLWVLLDIYEKDLERVFVGQKAELRTESHPGALLHARVAYVNPIIDEKTRTAQVLIEFENPNGTLRPGQFVTARLIGDMRHVGAAVLAVPRRAVTSVEGKNIVFVRVAQGFERRLVEIGTSDGEHTELRRGIDAGEEVATDGAFLLKSELLR